MINSIVYRSNSEYMTMRAAVLYVPGEEVASVKSTEVDKLGFIHVPNVSKLRGELFNIADVLAEWGVYVILIRKTMVSPNQFFMRDVAAPTPFGPIIAKMGLEARDGDEYFMKRFFGEQGIFFAVHGTATFEGADLLWIGRQEVLLGIGGRTNIEGAMQVQHVLNEKACNVSFSTVFSRMPQHLLGGLCIVDQTMALYRSDVLDPVTFLALKDKYDLHDCAGIDGVGRRQAMNAIVISPRVIMIPDDVPEAVKFYKSCGLSTIQVPATEIRKAGGGLACTVQVLQRELARS